MARMVIEGNVGLVVLLKPGIGVGGNFCTDGSGDGSCGGSGSGVDDDEYGGGGSTVTVVGT